MEHPCGSCGGSGECQDETHSGAVLVGDMMLDKCETCGQMPSNPGKCSVCGGTGVQDD
jgi:hypothetical protein